MASTPIPIAPDTYDREKFQSALTAIEQRLDIAGSAGGTLNTLAYTKSKNLASGTDLDTATIGGFYDVESAVNKPADAATWIYLVVQRSSESDQYIMQMVYDRNPAGENGWIRFRIAGTWSDWQIMQFGPVEILGEGEINSQTGTSYTLVLADKGKTVLRNNASANTLTVPPNSSVAFPINSFVNWAQTGAGITTIVAGSGVSLRSRNGLISAGQYAGGTMQKIATNEWLVFGDLES